MTHSPTVLVLGANGRFGSAATNAFAARGWRVLAQARRPLASSPDGAVHVAAALDDLDALERAAGGAAVVVYAVNPPHTDWASQMLPLARRGMALAERLGALFMLPGNVYGFGETMPLRLTEATPERPSTEKGRLRTMLEAEMRERSRRGAMRGVVIRAGDFLGGGPGSWIDLVIAKSLARGRLVYPGPLDRPHAWAYLPDLAEAFVAAAERKRGPAFETLHFAGYTLTGRELLDTVEAAAAAAGHAPAGGWRESQLSWPMVHALGLVSPMMREVAAMAYLWRIPHALDGTALEAAVGPLVTTPVLQAIRRSLEGLGLLAAYPAERARATPEALART